MADLSLKFCKDCKHFEPARQANGATVPAQCAHPQNIEWDLVHGVQKRSFSPQQMRGHDGSCKRQGEMFEPKGSTT